MKKRILKAVFLMTLAVVILLSVCSCKNTGKPIESTQDLPSTDDKKDTVESQGLTFVSSVDNTCYVSGIGSCEDTKVVIPCRSPAGEIVASIGPNAFEGCDSLLKVIIPEGVEVINDRAFYGCSRLESIVIPNSVKLIGYGAFKECVNLVSVSMTGAEHIEGSAFSACEKLKRVEMGEKVNVIHSYTFEACRALEEIVIPDSVSIIGNGAFKDCDAIIQVIIPKGVTSIGEMVFESCDKLNGVTFENTNGWSIGGESINVEDRSKNVEYLTSLSGDWYRK